MKIAITTDVIYPFTIGGSEIRTHEVLKRLAKKGHEVHIYGAKLWKGKATIKLDGINIHGISKYEGLSGSSGKRSVLDPIKLSIRLFLTLIKEKHDVIDNLSFVYFNCFSTKMVSIVKRTPLVFTWQQHFGDYFIGLLGKNYGTIGISFEKITTRLTKFNIASSQRVKNDLIKEGMKEKYIEVIHNGADIKAIKNTKASKAKYDIIFVGRLAYQKNPELLIKSIKLLKKEFPKIKVCFIGDGEKREKLVSMTNKLNLSKNIKFTGKIKDRKKVFQYMKSSKIFVLPSIFEGFPLTVVEANACGLPIITTNYKLNRTTHFIDGNGIITESNPQGLANAIKYLLNNKKERIRMGKKGEKMTEKYDWDIIAEETELYYEQIIKK